MTNLVSVIIPVYNCEKYLGEAIESVLAQTYKPIEVIVADDGSTDRTADAAKHFGNSIRYDFDLHSGTGATRNRGVNIAQGNFLAFLDADDLWVKDKLERQMTILKNDPQIDMVFGYVQQFYSPELNESRINSAQEVVKGVHAGCMLIKKESFFIAGPFETRWRVGEFLDWYLKATEAGLKTFLLSEVLMKRRIHNNNTVLRERQAQSDYVRALKASLDRRKKKQTFNP
jgi:glycosyltransferase involved in cell wall biosynthesis